MKPIANNYLKNVTKSIAFAASDVAKEDLMPNVAEFAETNKDFIKATYATLKNPVATFKRSVTALQESKVFKAVDYGIKNTFEDLASGNFYNKERENRDTARLGGMDISEESWNDLSEFGIDDDWEKNAKKGVKDEVTKGDKQVVDAINGSNQAMTNTVVNAVIKTTDASIKNSRTNMSVIYNQNERLFHGLHTDISVVGATLTAINELHKATLTNLDKNTSNFFTQSIKLDEERNKILKEMLEMQRMSYKSAIEKEQAELDKKKKKRNRFSDLTSSSGFPDLDAYFENVKHNFADTFSMFNMPGLSDDEDTNMLAAMFTSPLKDVVKSMVKGMVPATMRLAAKSLDENISGVFGTLMARLSNYRKNSDNPILAMLGGIFGVKNDMKTSLDTSKYHKGPVPFDGMTRKAIMDVIPRYLSKIEAYITNRPEEIFDYKSGKFVKTHDVFKRKETMKKNTIRSATSDVRRMMAPQIEAMRNTYAVQHHGDDTRFLELVEEWFDWLFEVDGDVNQPMPSGERYVHLSKEKNFRMMKKMYLEAGDYIDKYGRKRNRYSSKKTGLAGRTFSARESHNKQMESLERDQDIMMYLESVGLKNFDTHGKWKEGNFKATKASWATTQDDHGYTISNYLYDITKELMWQRDNWTAIGLNSGSRRGNSGSSQGLSDINSIVINPSYVEERRRQQQSDENRKSQKRKENEQRALEAIKSGKTPDTTGLDDEDIEQVMLYHRHYMILKETENEINRIDAEANSSSFSKFFDKVLYNATGRKIKKERDPNEPVTALERMFDKFDEMKARASALASAPAAVLTELIKAADNKIYQSLFKQETTLENPDGTTEKYDSFSDALIGGFSKVFDSLKTSADNVFSDIKAELGIDDFKKRFKDELSRIGGAAWAKFRGSNKEVWGDVYERVVKYSEGSDSKAAKLIQGFDANRKKAIEEAKKMAQRGVDYEDRRTERDIQDENISRLGITPLQIDASQDLTEEQKRQQALWESAGYARGTFGRPFMGRSALSKDELLFNKNGISRVRKTGVYDINTPTHILNSNDSIDLMRSAGIKTGPKRSIASNLADERKAINNISRHAEGTSAAVEEETNKYLSALKSYIPEMAAGGLVGGVTSLVLGIIGGPLIGGAVGAAASLVSKSDVINNALFGEKIGENGERAGGIISKDTTDLINKYLPDMTKYGMAGIIPGLITPLGPIGGLMIGGAIGFVKNNETLMEKFFGESGALKLDDNTKKGIAKLIPGAAVGVATSAAVSLFFGGPFGILGNAVIGSGLGMMATTDEFKEGVLGTLKNGVREGGLLGELSDAFEPLKDAANTFKRDILYIFERNILDPLARFVSPAARMLPRLIGFFPRLLADRLSNTIFGTVIRGWGGLLGNIGAFGLNTVGKVAGLATKPIRLLGGIGDSMVDWEVAHGRSNMNVADQFAWAKNRGKKLNAGAALAANLSTENLTDINQKIGGMLTTGSKNKDDITKNGNKIVGRLKGYRGNNGLKFSNKFINMVAKYCEQGGDVNEFINRLSNVPMVDKDGNKVTISANELHDIITGKGKNSSLAEMLAQQNNLINEGKKITGYTTEGAKALLRGIKGPDGEPVYTEEELNKMSPKQLKKKLQEVHRVTSDELVHRSADKVYESEEEKIAESTKSIEETTKNMLDVLIEMASGNTGDDFKDSDFYQNLSEEVERQQKEKEEKSDDGYKTTESGNEMFDTIMKQTSAGVNILGKQNYSSYNTDKLKALGLDPSKLSETTMDELSRDKGFKNGKANKLTGFLKHVGIINPNTKFQNIILKHAKELTENEINFANGNDYVIKNVLKAKKIFKCKEISEDVLSNYGFGSKYMGYATESVIKYVKHNQWITKLTNGKELTAELFEKIFNASKDQRAHELLISEVSNKPLQQFEQQIREITTRSRDKHDKLDEVIYGGYKRHESGQDSDTPDSDSGIQQNGIGTFLLGAIGGLGKLLFGGKKNDEEQGGPMGLIRKFGGNMPFFGGPVADSDQSTIDSADSDGTSIVADSEGNAMKYKKKPDGSTEPDTSDARTKAILNLKKAKEVALEKLQTAQLKASEAIHNAFDPERYGGKKKGKFNIWHLIIAGILFGPTIKKLFTKLFLPLWTEHLYPFIKEKVVPWVGERLTSIKNFVVDTAFPAVKNFFNETVLPAITDTISNVGNWLLENGPKIIWAGIKGGASLVGSVADGVVGGDKHNAGGKTTVKSDTVKNNKEFTDKNGKLITGDLKEGDVVYNANGDAGVVDADGNVVYTDKSKHGSTFLTTVGKASGRSFLNGMISSAGAGGLLTKIGVKATNAKLLGKAGTGLSALGTGAGFVPFVGTPAKLGLKTAGISLKVSDKAVNISQKAGSKFQKFLSKIGGKEVVDEVAEKAAKEGATNKAASFIKKLGGGVDDVAEDVAENPSFVARVLKKIAEVITTKLNKACETFFIAGKIRDMANAAKMTVGGFVDDFAKNIIDFIAKHIPESVKKSTKEAAAVLSSKEFLAMLSWITMLYDFTSGMDQAEAILGVKETNLITDVVCGLVKLLCGRIVILSIFPGLERICRFMYGLYSKFVGNDDYEKQKAEADKSTTEYNEQHGTTYSTEEYLSYTKSRSGKYWMDAKSLLKPLKHPIQSIKNFAKNPLKSLNSLSGNDFLGAIIDPTGTELKMGLGFLGDELSKLSIVKGAKSLIGNIFSSKDDPDSIKNNIVNKIKSKTGSISETINNGVSGVIGLVSSPILMVKSTISGFVDKIKGEFDSIGNIDSEKDEVLEKAKNGEISIFSKEYWSSGINTDKSFGSLIKSASSIIHRLIQAPMLLVKNFLGGIFSGVASVIGMLTGTKSDATESVQETMKSAGISNSFTEGTSSSLSSSTSGSNLITSTKTSNSGNSNSSKSSGGIKGFFTSVSNTLSKAGQVFKSLFGRGKYGRGYSKQIDPSISNIRFNISGDTEYQTVGDSACGPAAAVNVLESIYGRGGNEVLSASKFALNRGYKEYNGGIRPAFFTDYFNKNGLNSQLTYNTNTLENNINSGMPTVLMGTDPRGVSSSTPFGKSPHYVTVTGTDGKGHAIVQDPESKYDNLLYDTKTLMRNTTLGVSAFGKNTRIRRYLRPTSSRYDMPSARGKFGRGIPPTIDQMRAAGQQAVDYFRNNGYTYGNHRTCNPNELPPIVDRQEPKVVSCDRMVDSILYLLGFTDVGNRDVGPLREWCRQKGFRENTNYNNIQPGDVVFYSGHVFMVGNYLGDGLWERYDGGSTTRIVNPQPSHEGVDPNAFTRSFSFVNLVAPDGTSTVNGSVPPTTATTTTTIDGTTTVTQEPQGDSINSFLSGVMMNNRTGQVLTSLLGTGAANVMLNHLAATGTNGLSRTNRHYLKPTSEKYDMPQSARGSFIVPIGLSATGNSARGQIYPFKHYNLTQDQAERFAAACVMEQGENPEAVRTEMSQILNLTESSFGDKRGNDPVQVLNSNWYASVTKARYQSKEGSTPELAAVILDAANNGNRSLPPFVNEHDCFSDISSISTGSVRNKADYKQDQTIIHNRYGSTYTFWDFPHTEDPFGYTAEKQAEHDDWFAKGYVLPNGSGSPAAGNVANTGTVSTSSGNTSSSSSGLTFVGLTYKDKGKATNLISQSLAEYTANKANKKLTYDVNTGQWIHGSQTNSGVTTTGLTQNTTAATTLNTAVQTANTASTTSNNTNVGPLASNTSTRTADLKKKLAIVNGGILNKAINGLTSKSNKNKKTSKTIGPVANYKNITPVNGSSNLNKAINGLVGKGKYGRGKWGRGEAEIWNYLTQTLGFSENGAAAFMGNIVQESGLKSNNAENRVNKTGISDEDFTAQVNSGAISRDLFIQNPAYGGKGLYGYGLVQWTSPGRKGGMYDYVMGKYGDISSEAGQLEYIKQELENGYQNTYKAVTSPTMSLEEINRIVFKEYEGPGDNTEPTRLNAAKDILARYKGTTGSPMNQFTNPINAAQNGGLVSAVQNNVSNTGDSIASFLAGTQNYSRAGQALASLLGSSGDSGSSGNTSAINGDAATMATNSTGLSVGNSTTALGQPGALVSVAQSQIGYEETGENHTKYGRWFGMDGEQWCAMFVSWCANQAGIPESTMVKGAATYEMKPWYESKGPEIPSEQAQPGDVIFFYVPSKGRIGHIGIVEKGDGAGNVTTIEGNHNNAVGRVDYSKDRLTGERRAYIFRPPWTDVNSPITVQPDMEGVPSGANTATQNGNENWSAVGGNRNKPMSKYGQFKNSIRSGRGNMDSHKYPYYVRFSPNSKWAKEATDMDYADLAKYRKSNKSARPTSARGTAILPSTNIFNNSKDYSNLLTAIIQILSVIATNTDKLNAIIEILNDKLGINISAKDIANKNKNDIATQISATLKTNNATSNLNSILDGISNNELNNLIDSMNMLASA